MALYLLVLNLIAVPSASTLTIKNDDKEWPPDRMLGFRAAGVAKKISEENRFLILFTALGGRCTFPMVTCINTH